MKVKRLFILALLFLQGQSLFSQCISIELSVTWERGYHIYKKDSVVSIPKLNITYRNNCDSNYYFLKVSENRDGLPGAASGIIFDNSTSSLKKPDYQGLMQIFGKQYANQNFNVIFCSAIYHSSFWMVICDTTDITKPSENHTVNHCLNVFCNYIRLDNGWESNEPRKHRFEPSDLLPENNLCTVKDLFVFLKSGESYMDTYNLVPFQLVEGCFTFLIEDDAIESYVLSYETIFTDKRWVITPSGEITVKTIWHELELPKMVEKYHRYSGAFNTNKITVCFGDR